MSRPVCPCCLSDVKTTDGAEWATFECGTEARLYFLRGVTEATITAECNRRAVERMHTEEEEER